MYNQFNNSHISDNIKNIPVSNLKIGDHVVILREESDLFIYNYKLTDIKYDKIYIFNDNSGNNPSINSNIYYTYHNQDYGVKNLYTYNNNNSLVHLFQNENYYSYNEGLSLAISAIYNDCKDKKIVLNKFAFNNKSGKSLNNKVFIYVIIPLDSQTFMCLLKLFAYNGSTNSEDYVLFGEYNKDSSQNENINFAEFKFNLKNSRCNFNSIFEEIKNDLNCDIVEFEETLFALNYDLSYYLRDPNREINIEKVQNIFNKLGVDFDIKNKYSPCFEHKSRVKSYHFNNDIFVTINDQLVNWNNHYYEDEVLYTQNGLKYIIETPIELKNNKKNQILFKIASDIAEFEKDEKSGIDPRSGDFYENGEINNERITYKDFNGLIINDKLFNEGYYIKKYNYFIQTFDKKEINKIEERCKVINKLIE